MKAGELAKKGRTLEAASELRVAAETAGKEAPALRLEAALMLQRSGELRDAMALHSEVARDSSAGFDVRVRARYSENIIFWVLELSSLASPALEDVTRVRGELAELSRSIAALGGEEKALAKRLRDASGKINESRRSLSALVGPQDPMIQELDALAKACAEQRRALGGLGKSSGEASRALASAERSLSTVNRGIDALSSFVAKQVAGVKEGKGSLRELKKHHDDLLKRGSRVSAGALGRLDTVEASGAQASSALRTWQSLAQQVEDVVAAAEIVLGSAQ